MSPETSAPACADGEPCRVPRGTRRYRCATHGLLRPRRLWRSAQDDPSSGQDGTRRPAPTRRHRLMLSMFLIRWWGSASGSFHLAADAHPRASQIERGRELPDSPHRTRTHYVFKC